jgi:SurA N-terminal domain
MSNPFATFRKNQTYWMAALVLIAILAFVIAPMIDMITRSYRGGGGNDGVAARWNGGRITDAEIMETLRKRSALQAFMTSLAKKVIASGGNPGVPGFFHFNGQIYSMGINDNISRDSVMMTKIMLTQAKKMGVEFDDRAADEYLKEFCDGKVSDPEFNELLKANELTIFEVRQLITQDLTTTTTEGLVMGGQREPSPGKLWQNFLKLNRTAKIEAYKFPTADYLAKVTGKPTEAQLLELYEAGKMRPINVESAEPGFVRMDQANVEYVESNYTAWFDAEKAKVTEEDLKAEFEKQLAEGSLKVPLDYKAPSTTLPEATQPGTTSPEANANPAAPASTTPETTPASTNETPAPATPAPATPAPESGAPAGSPTTPAPEGTQTENPTTPTPAPAPGATSPDTPPATEPPAAGAPDNPQSSVIKKSDLKLVSFVQEQQPTTPAPTTPQDPPPATTDPTPAATVPSAEATTPAATTTPAPPAIEPSPATAPATQATPPAAGGNDEIAVAEPGKPATPPMRDMTFEEARERLTRTIADNRASKASLDVLTKLNNIMREFYLAHRRYEALKNSDGTGRKLEEPVRPDLKKFAAENGLKWGETGLGDRTTLGASQFGRSIALNGERAMGLAAEVAPNPQLELFAPIQSQFQGQDGYYMYYFWKTEAKPAFIPPLAEIRDQVEDAWRRIESRKYAEEAAQALLKKFEAGDKTWAAGLSETEQSLVVATEQFTWLTRLGNDIRMTNIPKLESVGDDFMKQVFNTEVGKFGVGSNYAKNVYYVFRVADVSPEAELQARFSNDQARQGPRQVASNESRADIDSWQRKILQELNVQFQ